jgi:CrcB protein
MLRLLLVCLGSALGGGARYLVAQAAPRLVGSALPWSTLAVNVVGSFLLALIMHVALVGGRISADARLFLTAGIMGGLTTYSTFNHETLSLLEHGAVARGLVNAGLTLAACALAGWSGFALGRALVGELKQPRPAPAPARDGGRS